MEEEQDKFVNLLGKNVRIKNVTSCNRKYKKGIFEFEDSKLVAYVIIEMVIDEYYGEIVGIIKLKETEEIRIVVSKKESKMYYNEIKGYFQEDDDLKNAKFKCLYESSAGVIVYKMLEGEPRFLIIYSKKDIAGFPKGHIEYGEDEKKAAKREVFEEVGIEVELDPTFKEKLHYNIKGTPINKEVVLFMSEISWFGRLNIDENEINKYEILKYDMACKRLGDNLVKILKKAYDYIYNKNAKKS